MTIHMTQREFDERCGGKKVQKSDKADKGGKRVKPENTARLSESAEQVNLFAWAIWNMPQHSDLRLLHHIPNGGHRHKAVAAKLKQEGVKPGVPDISLPVARLGYHGLYIEMKARGGRVTPEQQEWLDALNENGYLAVVCYGAEEAKKVVLGYLEGRIDECD